MKTIVKDGQKIIVAENAQEALRMFKKQLQKRRNTLMNDDPDKYTCWDDEEKGHSSYKNNRNYYDYGD